MVGVAVNVTFVPLQIVVLELVAIFIDGVTDVLTLIVIVLEVTVAGIAQVAFEDNTHITSFPFVNELLE